MRQKKREKLIEDRVKERIRMSKMGSYVAYTKYRLSLQRDGKYQEMYIPQSEWEREADRIANAIIAGRELAPKTKVRFVLEPHIPIFLSRTQKLLFIPPD